MNGKFRVWDVEKKKYDDRNFLLDKNGFLWLEENGELVWVDGKVVEDCTGLSAVKSYRGIRPEDLEIYAGDILLLERTYADGTHAKLTREVYWDKDECGFFVRDFPQRPMGTGICHPAKREWCESTEIIGNIHEVIK